MAWVKLHTDILGDPKLMRAARKGARGLEWTPWLLAFAKAADDDGRLTVSGEPAEPEDMAAGMPGCTPVRIKKACESLENLGILVRDTDGALRFSRWEERAGKPSDAPKSVRERVSRHRKHKQHNEKQESAPQDVTPRNALRNALHTHGCNATEVEVEVEGEVEEKQTHTAAAGAAGVRAGAKGEAVSGGVAVVVEAAASTTTFDLAWAEYPRRAGGNPRRDAEQAWNARRREKVAPEDMLAGVRRYRAYVEAEGIEGTRFVLQAATFFGPSRRFEEAWQPSKPREEPEHPEDRRLREIAEEQRRKSEQDEAWLVQRLRARGVLGPDEVLRPIGQAAA